MLGRLKGVVPVIQIGQRWERVVSISIIEERPAL